MDVAAHASGTVCWIDIGAPDPGAAAAFYGELFGWTYTDSGADGYRVALLDGRPVSGLGPAEDPGASLLDGGRQRRGHQRRVEAFTAF